LDNFCSLYFSSINTREGQAVTDQVVRQATPHLPIFKDENGTVNGEFWEIL
jgi:hypothetical protein